MLLAGLCVVLVGWLLWLVVVPRLAERILVNALQDAGFIVDSFQVDRIGLYGANLSDIRLQNDRMNLALAELEYSPLSLLSGEVHQITLTGLQWVVTYENQHLDLAIPPVLLDTDQAPQEPAPQTADTFRLPINRIALRDAKLILAYGKLRFPVANLDSQVSTSDQGRHADVTSQVHVLGVPVSVQGQIDFENATTSWRTKVNLAEPWHDVIRQQLDEMNLGFAFDIPGAIEATFATSPQDGVAFGISSEEAGVEFALLGDDMSLRWNVITQTGIESGTWNWSVKSHFNADVKQWQFGPLQVQGIRVQSNQTRTNQNAAYPQDQTRLIIERIAFLGKDDQPVVWIEGLDWPADQNAPLRFSLDTKLHAELAQLLNLPEPLDSSLIADLKLHVVDGIAKLAIKGQATHKNANGRDEEAIDLDLSLEHDLNQFGTGETRLRVQVPANLLGSWLQAMELMQPQNLTGHIALDLFTQIDDSIDIKTGGTIQLGHIDFEDHNLGLSIRNLHGEIVLDSLLGLSTPPRQAILIDKLTYSGFTFLNNTALITINGLDDVLFDRMTAYPESGGRFLVHAYRYQPDRPIRSELYIEQWNLVAFLEEVTSGKIRGNGLVYGRVPFEFNKGKLLLGANTWVHGEPGGGEISILDQQMRSLIINPLLSSDNPATRLVAERVEEALGKMRYDFLQGKLKLQENGSVTFQIEIRGQGLEGNKQEIGSLVVNLNSFGLLLNKVLLSPVSKRPSMQQLLQWMGGEERAQTPNRGSKRTDNPGEGELPAWMNEDGSIR